MNAALRRNTLLAMIAASGMLAHQVAGKAARDGFFLMQFTPTDMPKMVVTAAVTSLVLAILFSRLLRRLGTGLVIPVAFGASAALHLVEWGLQPVAPRAVAVAVYLHCAGLGAVLLSGFWLLISELFDPREAKVRVGRIAAAGTCGGVFGGLAAERLVAWFAPDVLLYLLGGLHALCAILAWVMRPPGAFSRHAEPDTSAREAFRRTPLFWRLAGIVFLGTGAAALLDYLFKVGAAEAIGRGPALVRYFAVYYTGCQILTFLAQTVLTKRVIQPLGIANTVALLPAATGASSLLAMVIPGFPMLVGARAMEAILRGSLYRSAYELLYTPVPPQDKRAVKTVIDVACDRIGDAAGAGAVQLLLWVAPRLVRFEVLGLTALVSAAMALVAIRAGSAYRGVLEEGLLRKAGAEGDLTAGTMAMGDDMGATVFESLVAVPAMAVAPSASASSSASSASASDSGSVPVAGATGGRDAADETLRALCELRSGVAERVVETLERDQSWNPLLGAQAIQLLGWDAVSLAARRFLERGGERSVGQISDGLLDPEVEFTIRRRLPRILARAGGGRSVEALFGGLSDTRFEVRFQCGRALDYLRQQDASLPFPPERIYAAVERELAVSKSVWRSWRVLDKRDSSDSYSFLDDVLRERADQRLEHVFSLLAVILPREPLMAAFRGLHEEDRAFRALALEYLETLLPVNIRERLWFVLEETPAAPRPASPEEAQALLESLLRTNASLAFRLHRGETGGS